MGRSPKEIYLKTSHVFGSSIFHEEGYASPKCTFQRQLINVSLGGMIVARKISLLM